MNVDYLIVGAGQAARRCAETLRENDGRASICMIGDEPHPPYDRPSLSKDALRAQDKDAATFVRKPDDYARLGIDLQIGVAVTQIMPVEQSVQLADGHRIQYQKMLLATGSRARHFPGHVAEQAPVFYLRTLADARRLRPVLTRTRRVVLIGGGFIGLEVAATATGLGCEAVVLEPGASLLRRSMPAVIGEFVARLHRARGVQLRLGTQVTRIDADTSGRAIVRTEGDSIDADVVIIGIGAQPNVELAVAAGLMVDNGIVVDEFCRTSVPNVFAAGDVTMHFNPLLGRHLRVESWQVAENQPVSAALSMLGKMQPYAELPWLWSDQFDSNLQTLGVFESAQTLVIRGDPAGNAFSVLALDEARRLRAAATINSGKEVAALRRLASSGRPLDAARIADSTVPLRSLL